jgi:prolipoprotein diacylglyceryltransferase
MPATSSYQAWIDKDAAIDPRLNETITIGIISYEFTGWRNSTGATVQDPLTVNAPNTYVASYTTQLSLPAIPGFPMEAIMAGVFLGLTVAIMKRKTRKHKSSS